MSPPAARPRAAGWVALAALTAAAVLIPGGVLAAHWLLRQSATDTRTDHRPLETVALTISRGGTVSVVPGPAGQVTVHSRLTWVRTRPVVRSGWDGATLRISVTCPSPRAIASCDAAVEVAVPAAVSVSAAGTGDLSVRGLTGGVDVRAAAGLVVLADLRGPVRVRLGAGQVTGTGLAVADTDVAVRSGDILLRYATAPRRVLGQTGGGDIRVTVPDGARYLVRDGSTTGDRRIDPAMLDPRSARRIEVATAGGDITVGYPPFD